MKFYIIIFETHDGEQAPCNQIYERRSYAVKRAQQWANKNVVGSSATVMTVSDRVMDTADVTFSAHGVQEF